MILNDSHPFLTRTVGSVGFAFVGVLVISELELELDGVVVDDDVGAAVGIAVVDGSGGGSSRCWEHPPASVNTLTPTIADRIRRDRRLMGTDAKHVRQPCRTSARYCPVMARYPSGIIGPLPGDDVSDPEARLAQMSLEMDHSPVGTSAPCMNPECTSPVDYIGVGPPNLYCSTTCRTRASVLRQRANQQLAIIQRTLRDARGLHGFPRQELRNRARLLEWWLLRLPTMDERASSLENDHHD